MSTENHLVHNDVMKWKHFPRYWPFCAGNSPVPGEFPTQRAVTRSFNIFFGLRLNKRLRKQSWGWWFETLSRPLLCHCNVVILFIMGNLYQLATVIIFKPRCLDIDLTNNALAKFVHRGLKMGCKKKVFLQGPLLQTSINFNSSIDKWSHA